MKKPSVLGAVVVVTLAFVWTGSAFAGRPLSTEDTGTVGKGAFEVEVGVDYLRYENDDEEISPGLALTYGLTDNLDIGLGVPFLFLRPDDGPDEEGLSDLELCLKYGFLEEAERYPSLALVGFVTLPTGDVDKGLGAGNSDMGILLVASKDLCDMTFHCNLGYQYVGSGQPNDVFLYGAAFERPLNEKWTLVGEIVGETSAAPDAVNCLLGVTYEVKENLVLDFGVSYDLADEEDSPDYGLTMGATFCF